MKTIRLALLTAIAATAVSCQPDPVYVPVYVPTEKKVYVKPKPTYKPKPVETAESFRAVER